MPRESGGNKIVIKLAHVNSVVPGSNDLHDQAVAFAALVNAKSRGRIEVPAHGASVLGGDDRDRELVLGGNIQRLLGI